MKNLSKDKKVFFLLIIYKLKKFLGLDMFMGIEGTMGILFEFGLKRSGKNADKSIKAIFDENKKYYQIFKEVGVQYKERFVIGVEMDSVSKPIITNFKVLKLKENGMIEKREDWLGFL